MTNGMNDPAMRALMMLQMLGERQGQELQQMQQMQAMPFQTQLLQNQVDAPGVQQSQFAEQQAMERARQEMMGSQFDKGYGLDLQRLAQQGSQFDRGQEFAERDFGFRQETAKYDRKDKKKGRKMLGRQLDQDRENMMGQMALKVTDPRTGGPANNLIAEFMKRQMGWDPTPFMPKNMDLETFNNLLKQRQQ